jgi:hypothetical protein
VCVCFFGVTHIYQKRQPYIKHTHNYIAYIQNTTITKKKHCVSDLYCVVYSYITIVGGISCSTFKHKSIKKERRFVASTEEEKERGESDSYIEPKQQQTSKQTRLTPLIHQYDDDATQV